RRRWSSGRRSGRWRSRWSWTWGPSFTGGVWSGPDEPADRGHRLVELGVQVGVLLAHGGGHAAVQMVVEQRDGHRLQGPAHRRDLGEHVHAVGVLVDHPLQAAHLT